MRCVRAPSASRRRTTSERAATATRVRSTWQVLNQFEGQSGAGRQPLNQAVAEDRGGRPEAAGRGGLVDVERQARGGLAEHLGGGAVARVAVTSDLGAYLAAVLRRSDEAKVEETIALRLGARALAGLGQ